MTGVNATGHKRRLFEQRGHILTCGYSRSGKGVNILLHALLDDLLSKNDAPSFVVLDPKGENLAVAGDHLFRSGYDVIVLNPFHIKQISEFAISRFNPFDMFDRDSPDFSEYVDLIRYAINPRDPQKHANSYFTDAAADLLRLYISHMMTQQKEEKSITTLYRWMRLAGEDRFELLNKMSLNPYFDIAFDAKALTGQLEEGGKGIVDVYSNAITSLGIFADERLRESMSKSDFDMASLSVKKTAVFICVSSSNLERVSPWLRIMMSSFIRLFETHYNPNRKVVMLMDEFPTMGRLEEFERGMGYLAGFNITLWPVVQNLVQLQTLYPNAWETYVGNAAIIHWMARDVFTAEYVSKRMPADLKFTGEYPDKTPKYHEKPLLTTAEIIYCQDIILEVDGLEKPMMLKKVPYWQVGKNHSKNPFY